MFRPALMPQMLQTLEKNFAHGIHDLRLFELRLVYQWNESSQTPKEIWHLALAMAGNRRPLHFLDKPEGVSLIDLKGLWEALSQKYWLQNAITAASDGRAFLHPKRQISLQSEGVALGYLGEGCLGDLLRINCAGCGSFCVVLFPGHPRWQSNERECSCHAFQKPGLPAHRLLEERLQRGVWTRY